MSYNSPPDRGSWSRPAYSSGERVGVDFGLRQHMLRVYNFMAAGLGLTGLVAYAAVATGFYQQIAGTPLIWLVMLAPIGVVLFLSFRIEHMGVATAQAVFWGYATLMGLSLAGVFLVYTGDVLTKKALMGALALYLDFINLFVLLLQLTGQRRD